LIFKKLLSLLNKDESITLDLKTHLNSTKEVKIQGVLFHIKKIRILDYLEGARVMQEIFSTYKTSEQKKAMDKMMVQNMEKAKSYMTDVIMAGVVKPQLTRDITKNPELIDINDVFNDWVLAQDLCKAIMDYTHGKKK
jgi:hypothetical protein